MSTRLVLSAAWLAALSAASGGCSSSLDIDGKAPSTLDGEDGSDGGTSGGDDGTTDTGGGEDTGDDVPDEVDGDGDGVLPSEGDCDDTDPEVYPGAEELCNGKDDDCDGVSDADFDDDRDGVADCADACPVQVDHASSMTPDGTWDAPYPEIQQGIDAAWAEGCDIVEVADGTYYENVDHGGAEVYVRSHAGPSATIVDGSGAGPVFTFATSESRGAGVDGFTITNGAAALGAGIRVDSADPVIVGNIIEGNTTLAGGGGGGIGLSNASPLIEANLIQLNDACYAGPEEGCDGGGINIRAGAPDIVANDIRDNSAGDGGGIWMVRSDALMYWNLIDGNIADDTDPVSGGQGGGVDIQVPSAGTLLTNNIITDNVASTHGGGVVVFEAGTAGEAVIQHNVIAWNVVTDTDNGAGIAVWQYTAPLVSHNAVLWNTGPGVYVNDDATVRYNLSYGNSGDWAGAVSSLVGIDGNFSTDPGLTRVSDNGDPTDDDWHPGSTSALVDAGDPAAPLDTDGTRADVGAYGGSYGGW